MTESLPPTGSIKNFFSKFALLGRRPLQERLEMSLEQQLAKRALDISLAAIGEPEEGPIGRLGLGLASLSRRAMLVKEDMGSNDPEISRRSIKLADTFVRHTSRFDDPKLTDDEKSQKLRVASLLIDSTVTTGRGMTPETSLNFTDFLIHQVSQGDFDIFMGRLEAGSLPKSLFSDKEVDRMTHIPDGKSVVGYSARATLVKSYRNTKSLEAAFEAIANME